MKRLLATILLLISLAAGAQSLPQGFLTHKDELIGVLHESWPTIPRPAVIPGLIEQESCITLKHSRCWATNVELKTDREYGFGLGQLTVTKKFNGFEEVKKLDPKLKAWKWEDRFNGRYQMMAIVAMVKRNYAAFSKTTDTKERFAFTLAAYNGGLGGVQSDKRVCMNTKGCNSDLWYGNVENTSLKQKTVATGYGKSFFQINREYPKRIWFERSPKYEPYITKEVIIQ